MIKTAILKGGYLIGIILLFSGVYSCQSSPETTITYERNEGELKSVSYEVKKERRAFRYAVDTAKMMELYKQKNELQSN